MAKVKVYYEFRTITTDQTIVLDRPAQVTFQLIGGLGESCVINNIYLLITRKDSVDGGKKLPWELILNNNENEIDITNYQVRFLITAGSYLNVIIKYYENPN